MTELYATTKKDLIDYPLRPKRQDGKQLPVRVTWIGTTPESQNQRARIGMGDKGIKDLADFSAKESRERAQKGDADYAAAKKREMQAKALRK